MQQQIKDYTSSSISVFAWHVALGILGPIRVGAIRGGQASEQAVRRVGKNTSPNAYPLDVMSAVNKTYMVVSSKEENAFQFS